ncbi:MAG: thioredoxin family protein [Bacteroidales bacterium]|nr:thioredoxin family protein [Bacteroidales bacterium]
MKILLTILSLLFIGFAYGQNKQEYEQLLKKELSLQDIVEDPEEFNRNLKTIIYHTLDSIDYQIFCGPAGNNAQLLALGALKNSVNSNSTSEDFITEKITYQELLEQLMQVREMEDYPKIREVVIAKNQLEKRNASQSDWQNDKILILKMGFNEQQTNEIYELVIEHEGLPYIELLGIYVQSLEQKKEEAKAKKMKNDNTKELFYLHGIKIYKDYQAGIRAAEEADKPVLLYFTGFGCVNGRKMEDSLFMNDEIAKHINDKLVLISLYVDDRSRLEENEIRYSKTLGREMKIKGHVYQEMQVKEFNANSQPFLVLLNTNKEEVSRIGYTKSVDDFKSFLGIKKETVK